MGYTSMLGANDPMGIYLKSLGAFEFQNIRLWGSQRRMLLKQLETHGMVYVPTSLVSPGLVRHSLVPDLLGPALAHHGLELGLAFLRASLDHLRVGLGPGLDHHGLDPGIYWRFQLGIRR